VQLDHRNRKGLIELPYEADSIREELQGRRNALEIVQAYLEDMQRSQADIAAALSINQGTVSRWI